MLCYVFNVFYSLAVTIMILVGNYISGLFLMAAFGIFADKIKGSKIFEKYNYGAGFALDIVAWISSWVAGGIFIVAKIKEKGTVNNQNWNSTANWNKAAGTVFD